MKTLYAIDIVNPFTKTVKMEALTELSKRIHENAAWDKVGSAFYDVTEALENGNVPDTDKVVEFLNDLNERPSTKKTVGFTLDASGLN